MSDQRRWRPELGRWRLLEHGFPEAPHKVALSTAGIPERESYDYWRNLAFADFEADAMCRCRDCGYSRTVSLTAEQALRLSLQPA
jgi:hypothetical protein